MRSIQAIEAEIMLFESQFVPAEIPAGTPDRKRLQLEACAESRRLACLPENIDRRLALHAERRAAERSAAASVAARRRAASAEHGQRQRIFRCLRKMGFSREHVSGKSAYYIRGDVRVRISDHDVPQTAERTYNVENGGFSWSGSGRSFVVGRDDADEFLAALSGKLQ